MADEQRFAGFWVRVLAALIDSLFILILIAPLLTAIYGSDYWFDRTLVKGPVDLIVNYVLPGVVIVVFWVYRSATPGKLILNLRIVDAVTREQPKTRQFILRYLGYYVSTFPLLLGLIWVGYDVRKQGWHDKLAKTVVVHDS